VTPSAPRPFQNQDDWSLARATFSVLMIAAAIVVVFLALTRDVPRLPTAPVVAHDGYETPLPGDRHANCRPGCSS
jgi:hypothetical protein